MLISLGCILLCTLGWVYIRNSVRGDAASDIVHNLPGPPADSLWTGNMHQFFDRRGLDFHERLAQDYGPVVKMHGPFWRRMLYLFDPKALQHVIVKQQAIFEEGRNFIDANLLVFGPGLLSTVGEQHRKQRKMLNPLFSVAHMRRILPIFYTASHTLCNAISSQLEDGSKEIDVLDWMSRVSLELIGQGGLGYNFDAFAEDVTNEYAEALKQFFAALQNVFIFRPLLPYLTAFGPPWVRRRLAELVPHASFQRVKTLIDIMAAHSEEIFNDKKLTMNEDGVIEEKQDIMSVLVRENLMASDEDKLPEGDIIAQVSTMTLAATDTTANSICRILHLLAQHPKAQQRLREEIIEARQGTDLSYDDLNQLPYLDAVLRETLRLFPPATLLSREALEDTVLPLSQPIYCVGGKVIQELPIAKGTEIFMGVLGSNTNKELWGDDALEWRPERWLSPLPSAVMEAPIPGVYNKSLAFLGGKRACIGFKFAETEMKAVLSVLIPNFTFDVTKKPIMWNVATVTYPTVGWDSTKPELPLFVTPLNGSCPSS
ncbi:cytochrome P450 [Fomitopsis serialis]|uniref:cytochrome P450 n=1 Tax=Fomitopsis serialis TaxID=139415 RepID=UPI0020083942|nr:cytochrome P450 [Neoantrodia serialis]KAH9935763.1 cytochrome P450 [Neoantrodia serialis]